MRCDLTFSETEKGFGVATRDPTGLPEQQPDAESLAVYKDENEFFKLLIAADLPIEDTRLLIVAALHTIAGSTPSLRTVVVDLTNRQIGILALQFSEQRTGQ